MATIDDILAATKIIDEAEMFVADGSIYKPDEVKTVVVDRTSVRDDSMSNGGVNATFNDVGLKENGNGYSVDKKIENGEGSSEDTDVKREGGIEKLEDENHVFQVGDFVWGKIKSHPWWPGQVYDMKDASEFALRYRQEGRMLVAFFGDGSCSWCLPSQMVPFVENFGDMSRDSRSKSFLSAIQSAVDEIGRVMESEMVCRCIPEEKRGVLARPVVENAGVKEGVRMPEVYGGRFSVPEFEPVELLSKLRNLAKTVCVDNVLELAVLRSRVSAFYRFKCGLQLPSYLDPVAVEGLEDQNKNATTPVANDFSVPIEVPILGPADDWLSSPSKATSDGRNNSKRKLKSMSELIGENTNVKPKIRKRATVKEGTDLLNEMSSRKRKKGEDSLSHRTSNKRMIDVLGAPEINNQNVSLETVEDDQKSSKAVIKEDMSNPKKKATASKSDISNAQTSNLGGTNGGDVSEKPKEIEVPSAENTHGEEKEGLEALTSPRERRKSKYLSPPFTNVQWRIGNSSVKTEKQIGSDKIPQKARSTEHITNDSVENLPEKQHLERFDASANKSPETVEHGKKLSFSISDVDAPLNEFLSKIHCVAVDPLHLSKVGSSDMIFAFGSALRSSTYVHGSDYKKLRRHKGTRKRKLSALLLETVEDDQKSSKAVKKEDMSQPKNIAKASKSNVVKLEGKASPCLVLTFVPGFVLPEKEDIIKHFRKFGSLNEQETNIMPGSNSIQVVFVNKSDVKKAFESSLHQNSFGFQNIYETQLPSAYGSSSKVALPHIPTHEGEDTSDDLASNVRLITTKLEIMTAILSNYQPKFSEEDKSVLKEEMKHLIENVNRVSEKVETASENVRAVAEEASS